MKTGSSETWAIILAGGSGDRFGGPKQFAMLGDKRLVDWSLDRAAATCAGIVLVMPDGEFEPVDTTPPIDAIVASGPTHYDSAKNGLAAVPVPVETVLIVTVSHALATADLYRRLLAAFTADVDAVFPAAPLSDALKSTDTDPPYRTTNKTALVQAQAPSIFRASLLRHAFASGLSAPEELELIERAGGQIAAIPGEATNLHITTPAELAMANALLPLVLSE